MFLFAWFIRDRNRRERIKRYTRLLRSAILKKYMALKKAKYSTTFSLICIAIKLCYFWRTQSLVIIGDSDSNNSNCKFVLISALDRIYRKDEKERDARIIVKSKNGGVDIVCIFTVYLVSKKKKRGFIISRHILYIWRKQNLRNKFMQYVCGGGNISYIALLISPIRR